jgi:hypothetical protein
LDKRELGKWEFGGFCIVEGDIAADELEVRYIPLPIKKVEKIYLEVHNLTSIEAANLLHMELDRRNLSDTIVIVRINGTLRSGTTNDLSIREYIDKIKNKGAFEVIFNKSEFHSPEYEPIHVDSTQTKEEIEGKLIFEYTQQQDVLDLPPKQLESKISLLLTELGLSQEEGSKGDYERKMVEAFYRIMELPIEEDAKEEGGEL